MHLNGKNRLRYSRKRGVQDSLEYSRKIQKVQYNGNRLMQPTSLKASAASSCTELLTQLCRQPCSPATHRRRKVRCLALARREKKFSGRCDPEPRNMGSSSSLPNAQRGAFPTQPGTKRQSAADRREKSCFEFVVSSASAAYQENENLRAAGLGRTAGRLLAPEGAQLHRRPLSHNRKIQKRKEIHIVSRCASSVQNGDMDSFLCKDNSDRRFYLGPTAL